MNEREWVRRIIPELKERLVPLLLENRENVDIMAHHRLLYALEIQTYNHHQVKKSDICNALRHPFETDLLIIDRISDTDWTPRVVIECKKGAVTTHDAITYSSKAATHKQVHPYLRYGVLIAELGGPVPGGSSITGLISISCSPFAEPSQPKKSGQC